MRVLRSDGRMSYLPEVEMPEDFGPFVAFRESFGFVPNIFRAQTLLPRVIAAEAQIAGTVLLKESALSRTLKECILLLVAAANQNTYCVTVHAHLLRSLGMSERQLDRILENYHSADLADTDRALLDFALKLSQRPTWVRREDVDGLRSLGIGDEQILETVLMTALTNFLCTLSIGLGATADFEPRKISLTTKDMVNRVISDRSRLPANHVHGTAGPYLRAVPQEENTFPPFAFFKEKFGFIPNIFRAQTLRPDVVQVEANAVETVLLTEDILSRVQKEYILLVISAANLNTYCVAVHCEMLRALGVPPDESDQIALDHRHADLSEPNAALLDFALKLAKRPIEFCGQDIDSLRKNGFSEEQILESVVMTALTQFLNTLPMGLGTTPDITPRRVFQENGMNLSAGEPRPTAGVRVSVSPEGHPEDEDAALVSRVQGGDVSAFEELVERHNRRIYRTLVGITGNTEEAEDATQDTFLKAFQHIRRFRGKSKFSTWLTRIAINTGVERTRRHKSVVSLDESGEEGDREFRPRQVRAWADDPEQAYSKKQLRELVEQGLMKLPSKYRVVVILRDIDQLSTEEAAEILGLGIPALKTRLLRGRLMLREELAPHFMISGAVKRRV